MGDKFRSSTCVYTSPSYRDQSGRFPLLSLGAFFLLSAASPNLLAVDIYPGTNIQSIVNANSAGTLYVLKSGIHRLQTITPKDGDVYQGETGTILSGARLLTTFIREGVYWVATNQTQRGPSATTVPCQTGREGCEYVEQLFFDDVPLQHVETLAQVAPGKWFFDYTADKIYFIDDPTNRKVETSVQTHAFVQGGLNVTIRSLIIEKYADPAQDGVISLGNGWLIQNNEIRLNHASAIRLSHNMKVLSNYIHHNGQKGLGDGGDNILVDGNEIAYNNTAGFEYRGAYGEAGGTKFTYCNNLIVRNNYVHDNDGPGLWLDGSNYGWTIESNRTIQNREAGILDEISYDGIIRYNVVESEGYIPYATQTSLWWRSGIQVSASPNAEIYGNTLINCDNGIGAVSNNRGTGNRGEFVVKNLNVHDNTIIQAKGTAAGMVAASDSGGYYFNAYTSWNNRFVAHRYKLPSLTGLLYTWYSGGSNYVDMNRDQWTSNGEDTSGTWMSATDSSVPSTRFAAGDRVQLIASAAILSLPSYSATVVSNLSAGAQGAITAVRGPIYADSALWWQVLWDTGTRGWSVDSVMQAASTGSDTTPPSVSITSPANGSTVSGKISVTASATDNVGVTKVEFYVDGTPLATDTSSPWTFSWDTSLAVAGNHTLSVKAYDAQGNIGNAAISVIVSATAADTTPPTIGISHPYNNSTISGIVSVTTNASDNVGVTKVEFSVDNVLMATVTTSPWGFAWDTSKNSAGSHVLSAKAYDAAGNTGGAVITVTIAAPGGDTTPPIIGITYPYNKTSVSGIVSVTANASDNVGVKKVEFSVDGILTATVASSPWGFAWDTSKISNGNHTLSAKAYDAQGNTGGAVITVRVKR